MAPHQEPDDSTGASIPADTQHAVSVSLPTWRANVGYEEGEEWVVSKMTTGYPRFFIHKSIQRLAKLVLSRYGKKGELAILFPTLKIAKRCQEFVQKRVAAPTAVRVVELILESKAAAQAGAEKRATSELAAVLFPEAEFKTAKQFWQHSGDGVSSRRAEFVERQLQGGFMVERKIERECKGPRRYQKKSIDWVTKPSEAETEDVEFTEYVEERFGRNLDLTFVDNAKLAIRKRIAGSLLDEPDVPDVSPEEARMVEGFTEDDVYLYPCGMSAIFNAHNILLEVRGQLKSVSYGFPYIDTLKILEKFGPGCYFYGNGSASDLDDLERKLAAGERILALFCEFPSNPLLKSPNLARIRDLADRFDFAVVVDETIGNFLNVHVLPFADIVVSSLTKVFSGDSNVMGGSLLLNPKSRYYQTIKKHLSTEYEDNLWAEDALFLERNSRDFAIRIKRINTTTEAVCDLLYNHPKIKAVYYPKYSDTIPYYNACRSKNGGYGGLFSVTFYNKPSAVAFFDSLETAKGPSLGTNFTLSSPYTLLAHYGELEWAAQFGVEADLVRVSVGLEDTTELIAVFEKALAVLDGVVE